MSNRRGFSLIELLVVIGIIAVLASLSLVVMGNLLDQAREDATAVLVSKVNGLLEDRVSAFDRAFSNSVRAEAGEALQRRLRLAVGLPPDSVVDPLRNTGVDEVLARKWVYRLNFPQSFAELIDTGGGTVDAGVFRPDLLTQQYPSVNWARHDASAESRATESAEVLHFMLTEMAVFGVPPVGTDTFTSAEVADTDGDGLPEFIDAWGNPLRFYRWPTRLLDRDHWTDSAGNYSPPLAANTFLHDRNEREITPGERRLAGLMIRGLPAYFLQPGSSPPEHRDPLMTDPDDPNGSLASEFLVLPGGSDGAGGLRSLFNEGTFHSLDVYHTPLVVSAGGDGLLGLWEPWEIKYDLDWSAAGTVDDDDAGGVGTITDENRVVDDTSAHDVVLGNLAQVLNDDAMVTKYGSVFSLEDILSDNISNRNRRAGGSN